MAINVIGVISVVVFYALILAVGIYFGWRQRRLLTKGAHSENIILAGRDIGLFVGVLTMTGNCENARFFIKKIIS